MKDRLCLCTFCSGHRAPCRSRAFQNYCCFVDITNTVMATNSTCTDKQPFVETQETEQEKLKTILPNCLAVIYTYKQ